MWRKNRFQASHISSHSTVRVAVSEGTLTCLAAAWLPGACCSVQAGECLLAVECTEMSLAID